MEFQTKNWALTVYFNIIHHDSDVIMRAMASQITSVLIVYTTVCSGADKESSKAARHSPLYEGGGGGGGNSPVIGEILSQRASNAENPSIWWHHHEILYLKICQVLSISTLVGNPKCLCRVELESHQVGDFFKNNLISLKHFSIPSTPQYKTHQIPKLKCFSSRLAVVFAQSIEVRC